ncbi:MAG: type II toxin-antitoxin system VapC family toxin, partial [Bacteroidota bacterium]
GRSYITLQMKVLDSNIIIYSIYPEYSYLRSLVSDRNNAVSAVSIVETLGYHKISADDKKYYESIFKVLKILDITPEVIDKAVEIRQSKNIKLGDALIAATALIYDLELNTRNLKDFQSIPDIKLHNPIIDV